MIGSASSTRGLAFLTRRCARPIESPPARWAFRFVRYEQCGVGVSHPTVIAVCSKYYDPGIIPKGFLVPHRRLEDRIQDLASQAIVAQDPAELTDIIRELRAALREHTLLGYESWLPRI